MTTVDEHYQHLLSRHYSWMFGSFADKVAEQRSILTAALADSTKAGGLAIDLGSGPGFQAVALAQLGFSPVIAVDTSAELLTELESHAAGLPIHTRQADLQTLPAIAPAADASVIVCMGDTLTHLPGKPEVSRLLLDVYAALAPGGAFVITFRDLTGELHGPSRFIPVRSDADTIMTCFLEYEDPESVNVHDLIYTREGTRWSLATGSYRKLRIGIDWLTGELSEAGFVIQTKGPCGRLLQVVARKS
jgi:SAM-dependent methyltransferase